MIHTMSKNDIFIIFTMDCERIERHSPPGGPENWQLSERAIRGFAHVLKENDLLATFFIVPENAEKHRVLWLELNGLGFELAVHYHPQSFRDERWRDYLGSYPYKEQKNQLKEAVKDWSRALRMKPESFRPGNFSANNDTFRVLYELGFRQGSVSVPERNIPEFRAVWTGAYPYPHHVSPINRLISGNLDFFEVPVTVNRERRVWQGKNPLELRIELAELKDHKETIEKWIRHLVEREIPIKHVLVITHNTFDYSNKSNKMRKRLEGIARYVYEIPEEYGLHPIPSTIKEIHLETHRRCSSSEKVVHN